MKKSTEHRYTKKTPSIIWVKRARMWCRTSEKDGKQVQEWVKEKP